MRNWARVAMITESGAQLTAWVNMRSVQLLVRSTDDTRTRIVFAAVDEDYMDAVEVIERPEELLLDTVDDERRNIKS